MQVRVLDVWPKGSTSFAFPHARVEYVEDDLEAYLTLIDRTGYATEPVRQIRQVSYINLNRLFR